MIKFTLSTIIASVCFRSSEIVLFKNSILLAVFAFIHAYVRKSVLFFRKDFLISFEFAVYEEQLDTNSCAKCITSRRRVSVERLSGTINVKDNYQKVSIIFHC